jgi:hypothetical protein
VEEARKTPARLAMRISAETLIGAVIRQFVFGLVVLALALPLLRWLHDRFNLGPPPTSAVVIIGAAVLICFVGGGVIGALCGSAGSRGKGISTPLAVVFALGWSLLVCAGAVPYYATSLLESAAKDVAGAALRERGALYGSAKETVGGVRDGRAREAAEKAARDTAGLAWDATKKAAVDKFAHVPALSLLLWTLVGPPIGAAFESAKAKRR